MRSKTVTRAERGGAPFLPEQRLPLQVALEAFTAGSAYVNHDDDAGRIEVGRRADLAVLDLDITDPATSGTRGPSDATVQVTVAAGRVVHDRITGASGGAASVP